MGIGVEYSHHEVAPSQHEIDLRYTDALTMADNVMTYRLVVKEIAMNHGVMRPSCQNPYLVKMAAECMYTSPSLRGIEMLFLIPGPVSPVRYREELYSRTPGTCPGDYPHHQSVGKLL